MVIRIPGIPALDTTLRNLDTPAWSFMPIFAPQNSNDYELIEKNTFRESGPYGI